MNATGPESAGAGGAGMGAGKGKRKVRPSSRIDAPVHVEQITMGYGVYISI